VGILYNNVGVSYDHAELLQELSDEKIQVTPSFLKKKNVGASYVGASYDHAQLLQELSDERFR
jgi:hypothetical protein